MSFSDGTNLEVAYRLREAGAWAAMRSFAVGDIVSEGGNTYVGIRGQHISGVFADDLADGWWEPYASNLAAHDGYHAVGATTPAASTASTINITSLAAVASTPGADGDYLVVDDPANPPRRYYERIDGQWVEQGGSGAQQYTQTFPAAAGQTTFTLAVAPTTPANTKLTLRGAPRDFGTDFAVAGTTVTLTMPGVTVFAGDTVIVQHD